jgi:hypothetical protein
MERNLRAYGYLIEDISPFKIGLILGGNNIYLAFLAFLAAAYQKKYCNIPKIG